MFCLMPLLFALNLFFSLCFLVTLWAIDLSSVHVNLVEITLLPI